MPVVATSHMWWFKLKFKFIKINIKSSVPKSQLTHFKGFNSDRELMAKTVPDSPEHSDHCRKFYRTEQWCKMGICKLQLHSGPLYVFVNKVLLSHSQAHSFTCCLWFLLCGHDRGSTSARPRKFTPWCSTGKFCWPWAQNILELHCPIIQ